MQCITYIADTIYQRQKVIAAHCKPKGKCVIGGKEISCHDHPTYPELLIKTQSPGESNRRLLAHTENVLKVIASQKIYIMSNVPRFMQVQTKGSHS